MAPADHLKGEHRTYYSTPLIALCAAIACVVAAVIGGGVGWVVADNHRAELTNRDCGLRHEANDRIAKYAELRDAVVRLTNTLRATRESERDAFRSIADAFDIQAQVRPLDRALKRAAEADHRIANDIDGIAFQRLPTTGC